MPELLAFARYARRVVFASFGLSLLYNITGLTFAVQGLLSPVVSAIIMPVSSITVVLFATGMVEWGRRQLNR
jgi:Cu+-exporting ATPase